MDLASFAGISAILCSAFLFLCQGASVPHLQTPLDEGSCQLVEGNEINSCQFEGCRFIVEYKCNGTEPADVITRTVSNGTVAVLKNVNTKILQRYRGITVVQVTIDQVNLTHGGVWKAQGYNTNILFLTVIDITQSNVSLIDSQSGFSCHASFDANPSVQLSYVLKWTEFKIMNGNKTVSNPNGPVHPYSNRKIAQSFTVLEQTGIIVCHFVIKPGLSCQGPTEITSSNSFSFAPPTPSPPTMAVQHDNLNHNTSPGSHNDTPTFAATAQNDDQHYCNCSIHSSLSNNPTVNTTVADHNQHDKQQCNCSNQESTANDTFIVIIVVPIIITIIVIIAIVIIAIVIFVKKSSIRKQDVLYTNTATTTNAAVSTSKPIHKQDSGEDEHSNPFLHKQPSCQSPHDKQTTQLRQLEAQEHTPPTATEDF